MSHSEKVARKQESPTTQWLYRQYCATTGNWNRVVQTTCILTLI